MIDIVLKDIIKITDAKLINGDESLIVNKIEIDSRKVSNETVFMPVLGEVQDGHIFLLKAFENGALYSFCEEKYYLENESELSDKNLILVDDTTKALHLLTTHIINECDVKTVGITGSLGKTSTKEMVYHVLSEKYNVHKNKGNFNNHIGLPLTCFDLDKGHDIAVLEMGMNHFKEIETLVNIVNPDVGVITNIGTSHIGILGSKDGIFKAKMEIVTHFNSNNTLIVNGNDEYLSKLESDDYELLKTGVDGDFYLNAYDLKRRKNGCYSYKLDYLGLIYDVKLNVLGKHNVNNSLLAIATGLQLSLSMKECVNGLFKFVENNKRLEVKEIYNDNKLIVDCYNASSESMISAIDVLVEMEGSKKIAILGDVLELGDFSKESHETVGEYISDKEVNYLYTYGEASKFIRTKAIELGFDEKNAFSFDDKDELVKEIRNLIDSNDVILIKGSLGMNMIEIVDELSL